MISFAPSHFLHVSTDLLWFLLNHTYVFVKFFCIRLESSIIFASAQVSLFHQPEWKKDPRKAATASLQTQVMDHLTLKYSCCKNTEYKITIQIQCADWRRESISTGKNTEQIRYDHYQPVLNASLKLGEG